MPKASKPSSLAEAQLFADLVPRPIDAVGADGHRARMRQRLLKAGPDSLADHEMLEMILFIALPRRDTKPIARALMARFRSFGGVIGAPASELIAVEGLGEAGAAALKLVQAASLRMLRQELADQPVLAIWDRLIDYVMGAMSHERIEQFRILFLDSRNRLRAQPVARGRRPDRGNHPGGGDDGDPRARPHHRREGKVVQLQGREAVLNVPAVRIPQTALACDTAGE
jgi:DNA repair protein RadC